MPEYGDLDQQYGSSSSLLDFVLKNQLAEIKPNKVVDFGAGGGKNGRLIRGILSDKCRIVAVEGSERTVQMLLSIKGLYDEVQHDLLQEWTRKNTTSHNVAIFGDVLEHLSAKEIHQVIDRSLKYFEQIIIVAPLHDIFQEAAYDNPLEVHRSYITSNFFDKYGPIEKHIITSPDYTIMNVRIVSGAQRTGLTKNIFGTIFHYCMIILQPFGLARPFVNFLKRFFLKYKYLIRN